MENDGFVIELSDGTEVKLVECWDCCDDCRDCGSFINVVDCETGKIIAEFSGTLPDTDDEDFDLSEYVKEIENKIYNS